MRVLLKNTLLLVIRLVTVLIIFQFCRLLYFLYNIAYFENIDVVSYFRIMYGSLKFDISAVFYINILLIFFSLLPSILITKNWYKKMLSYLFIILNSIGVLVNIMDIFYYPFAKNRFTISFIEEFSNEQNPLSFILKFIIEYWYAVPFFLIIVYLLIQISKKTELQIKNLKITAKNLVISTILALSFFTITVYGCRGSFIYKNRPITISNAGKYTNNPNEISLIINTPFSLIRTATIKDLKKKNFFAKNNYPVIKKYKSKKESKKNVVIIILESMSTEYYGFFNKEKEGYQGYTPFLDSLINYSFTSYNSFSNGRKSIDAIPSVFASIPNMEFHFSLSKYCTNNISGIGKILKNQGYETSFFHGAPNGSMGFESMAKLCGLEEYYGMDDYKNRGDFDGLWGIWDHKFLDFYAKNLNKINEPFLSSIFTCSSHHPYKIPKEYINKFNKGDHPMHECVQYADHSLRLFFKEIKNESWYENTLFVITADHTNVSKFPEYRSSIGIFRVPIIFFDPSNPKLIGSTENIFQHIDIMPSILYYLGYNKPFFAFGNNIFSSNDSTGFAINYNNDIQLITKEYLFIYDNNLNEITKIFNFKKDKILRNNIIDSIKKERIIRKEKKIKSFIQSYNNRMIDNNLVVE